jgi:hypothetical protein
MNRVVVKGTNRESRQMVLCFCPSQAVTSSADDQLLKMDRKLIELIRHEADTHNIILCF